MLRRFDRLLGVPWRSLPPQGDYDGAFFVKSYFDDAPSYTVLVTDLRTLWAEDVDADALGLKFDSGDLRALGDSARRKTCKELGETLKMQKHGARYRLSEPESQEMTLRVEVPLQVATAEWEFRLRPIGEALGTGAGVDLGATVPRLFHAHVVVPLAVLGEEYKRRLLRLEELLRQKDKELEALRESALDRDGPGKARTQPFDKEAFHQKMQEDLMMPGYTVQKLGKALLEGPDARVRYEEKDLSTEEEVKESEVKKKERETMRLQKEPNREAKRREQERAKKFR
ncbi:hypothetical protein DFJ74DRAFT_701375 [Hyaloraphidium curvatum]|nr:hypothetical protein DFJ74DRAFT_701375 [Hyaloraphidium curvatum]